MFLHLLSSDDQAHFLRIARLVSISDNRVLVNGNDPAEASIADHGGKVSIEESPHEKAILESFARECGIGKSAHDDVLAASFSREAEKVSQTESLDEKLLDRLKKLPLAKLNESNERIIAAKDLLDELIAQRKDLSNLPAVPKIMLYELMLLALADGTVSRTEDQMLRYFAKAHAVEGFIYDDLLERAESTNREVARTISLILE